MNSPDREVTKLKVDARLAKATYIMFAMLILGVVFASVIGIFRQMDQVTQQNAALMEEATAAAESMQDQAANLAQVVGVFKLNGMQRAAARQSGGIGKMRTAAPAKKAAPKAGIAVAAPHPKRIANAIPVNGGEWQQF
jgi:hypothetical protein